MSFKIRYHSAVVKDDIPKLSAEWRSIIKAAIEDKLAARPEVFGRPLRYSLKGYRKLRIGDYRIVFRIDEDTVKILAIQHRAVVYNHLNKRMRRIT